MVCNPIRVETLNRDQHKEKETKMKLRENLTSTASTTNYCHSQVFPPFIFDCFQLLHTRNSQKLDDGSSGNDATANQACSDHLTAHPTE